MNRPHLNVTLLYLNQKALKRKANFEESKKFKEQLQAYKREIAEKNEE